MPVSPTKLAAVAVGGVAIFLGAGAISVFAAGDPGMLVIVGASLACGSVGLFVVALRLWFWVPAPGARRSPRRATTPLSRGQRLGHVAVGVIGLVLAGHALVTGSKEQVRGPAVTREARPGQFWPLVLLYGGVGAFMLYRGLQRPPGEPGGRRGREPPDRGLPGRPARPARPATPPVDDRREEDR